MSGALASLLVAALAAPLEAGEAALGDWTVGSARLSITREAGRLVGRLGADGSQCPLPAGTEVLRGAVLDDNLSAQVRLCLLAPACGADPGNALAILLVTRQLTGGVHAKAACAEGVRSLVLRRPGQAAMAMTAPDPAQRLSRMPPPARPSPRAVPSAGVKAPPDAAGARTSIAAATPALGFRDDVPPGQIPGRPVGGPHAEGYDPRDARAPAAPQGEAARSLRAGLAALQGGQFERARKHFQEALAQDPQRAEAYNGVGVTFYARSDLDEALAWYKRALEADPRFGDAFYNMACAYALQGHRELAFRYLRLAALNHYSEREQLEQDPDLASLRAAPEWKEIVAAMSPPSRPPRGARKP